MKNGLIFIFQLKKEVFTLFGLLITDGISGIYYEDPDGNLIEIFFEHFRSAEEFKENISPDFEDEPIGTNMDMEVLYKMYKDNVPFEKLIVKGNTVPDGKKAVSGLDAVKNMTKKYKD